MDFLELLEWLLLVPALFCLIGTFFSFIKEESWWVRLFDFPRLQMVVLIFVSALLLYWFDDDFPVFRNILWGLLGVSLVLHAWVIFPYFSVANKDVKDATDISENTPTVSILVANVYMYNRDSQGCKNVIATEDPDIVFMVETDPWWDKEMDYLKEKYPYQIRKPIPNTYGLLFYSKQEPLEVDVKYWVQDDVPSIVATYKLDEHNTFDFYGVHPRPPAPEEAKSSVPRDAELVLVGREIKEKDKPTIVAGDFNDVAWSHTSRLFRRIGNLLDPRVGRGMYSTFHADHTLLRWPLDHIFHTKEFQVVEIKRLEYVGSDHFPIFIKLAFLPEKKHEQDVETADESDEEEADRKIEKAEQDETTMLEETK